MQNMKSPPKYCVPVFLIATVFLIAMAYQGHNNGLLTVFHYKNTPKQYTEIFFSSKNEKFCWKIYLIFAQNFIDCGYTLEPPHRGILMSTDNLCFGSKIRKKRGLRG